MRRLAFFVVGKGTLRWSGGQTTVCHQVWVIDGFSAWTHLRCLRVVLPCLSVPRAKSRACCTTCRNRQAKMHQAELGPHGFHIAHFFQVLANGPLRTSFVGGQIVALTPALIACMRASAAAMPESIALWLPLMRGTVDHAHGATQQAHHRGTSLRHRLKPPSVIARAP